MLTEKWLTMTLRPQFHRISWDSLYIHYGYEIHYKFIMVVTRKKSTRQAFLILQKLLKYPLSHNLDPKLPLVSGNEKIDTIPTKRSDKVHPAECWWHFGLNHTHRCTNHWLWKYLNICNIWNMSEIGCGSTALHQTGSSKQDHWRLRYWREICHQVPYIIVY